MVVVLTTTPHRTAAELNRFNCVTAAAGDPAELASEGPFDVVCTTFHPAASYRMTQSIRSMAALVAKGAA